MFMHRIAGNARPWYPAAIRSTRYPALVVRPMVCAHSVHQMKIRLAKVGRRKGMMSTDKVFRPGQIIYRAVKVVER